MELKDKKLNVKEQRFFDSCERSSLKINFERENKEKRTFDPREIIEQQNKAMPVPEMMKKDREKIAKMVNKKLM